MKTHIIPIFIPHKGCPHDCVFCNQKKISGRIEPPSPEDIRKIIDEHLETDHGENIEIAFYGGSFTGIPLEEQKMYLKIADEYRRSIKDNFNKELKIRASTRPDCMGQDIIELLTQYNVDIIELGVQSMNDHILRMSGRGHTSADVYDAVAALKRAGIDVGIQTMTGLPGDTYNSAVETANKVIKVKPSVVRIYPALVIKNTELEDMLDRSEYIPMELDEAVMLCADLLEMYETAGIKVIRVGLQATGNINADSEEGDVRGGPFHPAFRQLVESRRVYNRIIDRIENFDEKGLVKFNSNDDLILEIQCENKIIYAESQKFSLSDIMGNKRENYVKLNREYGYTLKIRH